MLNRLSILKTFLWASVGVLAAITVVRFTHGLGAVTNLSDQAPWGLWIGFDVMAGVALAAGGFVIAASVYIFGLEEYKSCARPAILTALLGYIAVAVGLLYDLGLPWHIWHPMVYWQHHSVLFEVATCVILYLGVLSLEFAPVILEHPLFGHPIFRTALGILKRVTIPLVIAGIVLSTLHQASLGSLFLIAPFRVHPLWYSPIIYVLFFVSAVGLGLMTVVLESLLSGYFLKHEVKTHLMSGMGLAASIVLWVYLAIRLGDLAVRGVLGTALDGSWQSNLFIFELAVCAVIPGTLLLFKKVRSTIPGMAVCATLTVLGMVGNRLDVSIVAFARPEGSGYFPSWAEIAVSLGIVSCCALVFLFFVERLKVYDEPVHIEEDTPSHDAATLHGLMPSEVASPRRYSLVTITAAVVALLFLPVRGAEPLVTTVSAPRSVDGLTIDREHGDFASLVLLEPGGSLPEGVDAVPLLTIDGNRDGTLVLFNHDGHVEREGGNDSCVLCHHLNLPFDRNSSCFECHRDMYEPTSVFDHARHVEELNGVGGCSECHSEEEAVKSYETATECVECHESPELALPIIAPPEPRWKDAVGYMDAMHNLCKTCHTQRAQQEPERFSDLLDRCDACHDADVDRDISVFTPARDRSDTRTARGQR
ncbi:MAG: Ni/Fe-hydrogenase cytochrome b subunit [Gemmatimonadetes bacterium]|nr:Ni/Fe-hydrogenase cytochrome b subunit [Gemmatimonadota bacterium]